MKIALISPNHQHLKAMSAVLQARSHEVVQVEGGKSRMRAIAEHDAPDMMLVDGMCCDPAELTQVEWVTFHHPNIAVVLLCASQTPEFLIQSMRAGVREVLPSPATASALEAAVNRVAAKRAGVGQHPQGKVFAFISAKGGSGATFLATNLGYQLARERSVLLIDMNLQFGDALSFVHDGRPASTVADVARDITRLDAALLASSTVRVTPNFSVLAAPEDLAHAMEVKPEHLDAIVTLAMSHYDFVLLDANRTLDTTAIRALDRAHRIYIVLQSSLQHVRNAHKLLQVFNSLGYPADKAELIVNRWENSSEIGLEQIRKTVGSVRITTVANSYREVSAAINHGDPLARTARGNTVARQIEDLCDGLLPRREDNRGLLGRIFRRA
jgi:pilus assembly protein CpaE